VYHAHGISKAAFSGAEHVRGRGRARHNIWGVTSPGKWLRPQDMACGTRCAPEGEKKIRNSGFSDPGRNERRKETAY